MSIDKNEAGLKNNSSENDPENGRNIDLTDHPGLKKMSENPNPRANENISGEGSGSDTGSTANDRTDEAGSEITDGEDG